MIKDVLVFTPIRSRDGKFHRFERETQDAVMDFEWDGPIAYLWQRDNPEPKQRDTRKRAVMNHLHQYQRARRLFLQSEHDAMMIIESDIIPPPDTIKKLAALEADCAYGVYRFRAANVINIFEQYPRPARNVGEPLSNFPRKLKKAVDKRIVECSGGGFGCLLVTKEVLKQVPFRTEWPKNGSHCDTFWTNDVYKQGFKMMADMSVICGHVKPDGVILWPDL